MKKQVTNKIHISKFVFLFGLFLFCVIIGRLIYLNLAINIDGINLKEFSKNRNTKKETLFASRGTIYDKNEEVLAETVDSYTVIAYLDSSRSKNSVKPKHVVDIEETSKKLSPLLNMSEERIYNLLNQKGLYQVELGPGGKGLSEIQKEEIAKLDLPGIDFISTTKRYYPNLDFASYIIGYVTRDDNDNVIGEMGIEAKYNDKLTGINGSITYQRDANGYRLINSPEIKIDKQDGYDVYLTIDSNIQLMAERALNSAFEESNASKAIFVVAEAKTGKIVASATKPSFDPNKKNIENYLDPLVSTSFEPGSTMKTYTYMATMEKGNYNGEDTYMSGTMELSGYTIKDWNNYGWGNITYDYGYTMSSNIGVANLTQKYITGTELQEYYKKLGFGKKTGIELPGEVEGQVKFKYDVEVANASFGQGVMTTPIQMIQALTSISNDGYLLKPTIVEKIVNPNTNEVVYQNKKQKGTKVASIETVNHIKELMKGVVEYGTGESYNLDGYDIIGKTGTAQVFNASTGTYYKSSVRSIKSFNGMYPKDNPKYIFYIAFEDAVNNTMPDAVKSLIQDIEAYYNLTNVRASKSSNFRLGNYLNKNLEEVKNILDINQIKYDVVGDGDKVINQFPFINKIPNGKVILLTNGNFTETDIKGYSNKMVNSYCEMISVECNISGNGYVNSYNIERDENDIPIKIDIVLSDKYEEIMKTGESNE